METNYQDFIGTYKDVFPSGYCSHLINDTEKALNASMGHDRQSSEKAKKHQKDDISINGHWLYDSSYNGQSVADIFRDRMQLCIEQYINFYSVLTNCRLYSNDMKIQKTSPGQGYHMWHFEQGSPDVASRVLTFIAYLNTIKPENGGETEFLYQKKRISPVENTMLIWPAAYTHAHRGNPVLGDGHKYIITGWFNII